MTKLSVVISAFNEEKKIEDCLKSVSFADEIIVVDGSSTDKTVQTAQKYTSKIFKRPNNPMLNVNKNFGFSKAIGDWILSLDADERVTPELKDEIESRIKNQESGVNGYWIPRKNIIFGKCIEHTGWYPDNQLRLFKKGKGKFPAEHVHEMIKIEGEAGHFKNNIIHYNYETIFQFVQKLINIYGPNEAEQLLKNGYKFNWHDAIRFPLKEFLSRFFAREGYKDGFHGLILSMLMAFYHFIVFANIWERLGFKEVKDENFMEESEKEFKKSYKDLSFWVSANKLEKIKNPIMKQLHKLIYKFR